MDQQEQSRWRPTRRQLLQLAGLAVLAFLITVVCGYLFGWEWTGLPKRTLWDWLDLLIVPVVLAVGGYLFSRSDNRATQAATERRAQDEALRAYIDAMTDLLLNHHLLSPSLAAQEALREDDAPPIRGSRTFTAAELLATGRTLTVLLALDGSHKASVVRFLHEVQLISRRDGGVVKMTTADLRGAELHSAKLFFARLPGVDLREAKLPETDLSGADLRSVDLRGADLSGANLSDVDLTGAKLSGADLSTADLSRADLREVKGWTEEQLTSASSLEGATMPDGQKYEDWLKGKEERREDGKSTSPS